MSSVTLFQLATIEYVISPTLYVVPQWYMVGTGSGRSQIWLHSGPRQRSVSREEAVSYGQGWPSPIGAGSLLSRSEHSCVLLPACLRTLTLKMRTLVPRSHCPFVESAGSLISSPSTQ